MVAYMRFPEFGGAPPELYKEVDLPTARLSSFSNPNEPIPCCLWKTKESFELGDMISAPETLSISPDGTKAVLGCTDKFEMRAFVISLENPEPAKRNP